MSYDSIPAEIKRLKQWVCCWNTSKIPMQTRELKAASASDPGTWSSFDEASAAVESGRYDYVGFVFADNGIVGIDIDVGFDDRLLSPLAVDIISVCRSYTEISKSGRGVHILLKGDLPFHGRNNRAGVEIYKSRRYFITTGRVLFYPEIQRNQRAIDYVIGKYFKETENATETSSTANRIYSGVYAPPAGGKITLRPCYPEIQQGCRNISLASLAGQLHTTGYDKSFIYRELLFANSAACKPPLPSREIETITNSICRYRR